MNNSATLFQKPHLSEEMLFEYLDSELTSSDQQAVDKHLTSCPECQAKLEEAKELFFTIQSQPEIRLSRDLTESVLGELFPEEEPSLIIRLGVPIQFVLASVLLFLSIPFLIGTTSLEIIRSTILQNSAETGILLQTWFEEILNLLVELNTMGMGFLEIPQFPFSIYTVLPLIAAASLIWFIGNGIILRAEFKDQHPTKKLVR